MGNIRLRAEIREFAESMEVLAKQTGLHDDNDKTYLYARAKEGMQVIADSVLTDADALVKHCANMGLIMMMLADNDREQHEHPVALMELNKKILEKEADE